MMYEVIFILLCIFVAVQILSLFKWCWIGIHSWKYNKDKNRRKCRNCKKKQTQFFMLGELIWTNDEPSIKIKLPPH